VTAVGLFLLAIQGPGITRIWRECGRRPPEQLFI